MKKNRVKTIKVKLGDDKTPIILSGKKVKRVVYK